MGGKNKQAQRIKNNARPSSSGRSAELLGTSINPFVGFSAVKDTPLSVLTGLSFTATSIDDAELNIDTNFQLVLKKMNKKDSTTKLKALQEFTDLVQSNESDAVKAILTFWPRLYAALAVDTEHRVREATHIAHRAVVLKVKRGIAPHLKQLVGPWFTSQYDTYAPAAAAATQSFQDAFPPYKMQEAIVFCQDEILAYICDNIIIHTPQTISNPKTTTPEEAEAKYERLLISSLQGYTLYLSKLNIEQLKAAEELNLKIISNSKFWKLSKSKISLIRAAWFGCIVALFQNAPFLLNSEMQQVTLAVFCNLDESEPVVLNATWDAALYIISNVENWSSYVSIEKLVLPKLWKVLKDAGQGSASVIYPNLLPLISHIPANIDVKTLYSNFFDNCRIGMKKKNVIQSRSELSAISSSFIECFRYITMKNKTDLELCQSLITAHLIPIIEWSFTEESVSLKSLYSEISTLLQYWEKNKSVPENVNYYTLLSIFWKDVATVIQSSITKSQTQICTKEKCLSIINKHIELFLCLKKTTSTRPRKHSVKFQSPMPTSEISDGSSNSSQTELDNSVLIDLNELVAISCAFYLKFVKENRRNELIDPICLLMRKFETKHLFEYLNKINNETGDNSANLVELLKNVFLKFLKIKSTCSTSVVDTIFIIFKYLNDEEKTFTLESIVKLTNEDCFCWCVAKTLSHPYCNDKIIQNWLSTIHVTKLLVSIATSMLNDEISTDKSLLLKQALTQNITGDLYISKDACQEIMLIFCNCLLTPFDYPFTIDVCASFAAQLSSTLYTEQTLLTYGDQLILALFSLSCCTNCDEEIISKDTLWEVSTAWQDILVTLISADLLTEFENILWKFKKVIENEFMNCDSTDYLVIERLSTVVVDLFKCVLQTHAKDNLLDRITNTLLTLPVNLRSIKQQVINICNCARVLTGDLSWVEQNPVPQNILNEIWDHSTIVKYLLWHEFIINVISNLYKKNQEEIFGVDDGFPDDPKEPILEDYNQQINNLIVNSVTCYSYITILMEYYKTTKLYNELLNTTDKIQSELSDLLNNILSKEILEIIIQEIENNCCDTAYFLNKDLLPNSDKLKTVFRKLKKTERTLHLTQLFSKHINFDQMVETKDKTEKIIITRMLLSCDDIEVQIAEVMSAIIAMKDKNGESLLYNKDISKCDWAEVQIVVEIIRFLSVVIKEKPLQLSNIHWDLVLIALTAWTGALNKSKQNYRQLLVAEFIAAVCELFITFHSFAQNTELVEQLNQSCANIVTEYNDIFAEDVNVSLISMWIHISEQEVQLNNTGIALYPALITIGNIIQHIDRNYLIQFGNTKLPKWPSYVQICGNLLKTPVSILQLWGYHGLKHVIPPLIVIDEKLMNESETRTYGLLSSQLGHFLSSVQDVVLTMLMDFRLGEENCRVKPFTDSYTFTFGYLLLWDIFLSYCQQASTDLRYQYSDWLRSGDYLKNLLNNIFRLMPNEVLHCTETKRSSVVDLFAEEPKFTISDPPTSEVLEHAVCWVYAKALTHLPALVRQWWAEAESRAAHTADQVTAAHVSPVLIAHELKDVTDRRKTAGDNMRVTVRPTTREVIATYTVDEARMELVITLPINHPLGAVHVESSKQIGGTAQWRNWVMQLTVFLTHQNGRIWDGLALWKSNLDKKFDGIEECYICFAVLHSATCQLPKLSCQTCKKKFHAPCLYKWFSTSNKSTCPICRNLF